MTDHGIFVNIYRRQDGTLRRGCRWRSRAVAREMISPLHEEMHLETRKLADNETISDATYGSPAALDLAEPRP